MMLKRRKTLIRSAPFKTKTKLNGWTIFLLLVISVTIITLWLVEYKLQPMMHVIAKTEAKKIAQDAMLKGIKSMQSEVGPGLNKMMRIEKDEHGKISFVEIDMHLQSQVYEKVTSSIQQEFKQLDNKNIIMSLGQMMQSSLLANYGPSIPLQIWPKGATKVTLTPELRSTGINMVMVTLHLQVENDMEILIPFSKNEIPVNFEYPVAQAMVVGEVPEYYFYNDQDNMKKGQVIPTPAILPKERVD